MPESVTLNEELKLVEVQSSGEISISEWRETLDEIERLCREKNCMRVLVDTTQITKIPEIVDIFVTVPEAMPRHLRFAVFTGEGLPVRNKLKFLENVSQNRGIQILVFTTRQEALDWLVPSRD